MRCATRKAWKAGKKGRRAGKQMSIKIALAASLLLAMLCIFSSDVANSLPPPSAEFYGSARNAAQAPVAIGTNISAYDPDGVMCGNYIVIQAGFYGVLSCNGDDPDTAADEGAVENDIITFRIFGNNAITLNDTRWSAGMFKRADLFINRPPELNPIGNLNATEEVLFYYDFNATDPDNDTITFSRIISPSFAKFSINSSSGVVSFMPENSDVRSYFVRIIVSDGYLTDHEDITFTIINVNDPPYFMQNLTNQTVNESSLFYYDINCSDDDIIHGDSISYSTNFSILGINPISGLISWVPDNNHTGNFTVNVTCSDGEAEVSQTFSLEVVNINNPPVLSGVVDKNVLSTATLRFNISAYDADDDPVTFSSNDSRLSVTQIEAYLATVTFVASDYPVTNYTFTITLSDGQLSDTKNLTIRVRQAPFCGDGVCNAGENCYTCPGDCGECPAGEGGEGGGEGGGAAGAAGLAGAIGAITFEDILESRFQEQYFCLEDWLCSGWGNCVPTVWHGDYADGIQARTCRDLNDCGTQNSKPLEQRNCRYIPPPSCYDGKKNQGEEKVDCGGPCPPCPTCSDSIQNQGELGVDCGGPCEPCTMLKYAQLVFERPAPLLVMPQFREFPWMLLLIIILVNIFAVTYDFRKLHYIRAQPFEAFVKKMREYRPKRRKLYKFLANFDSLEMLTILYLFFIGSLYTYNVWLWLGAVLLTPVVVAMVFRQLEYNDYRRMTAERRMLELHNREIRYFMMQELEIINELYSKVIGLIGGTSHKKLPLPAKTAYETILNTRQQLHKLLDLSSEVLNYAVDHRAEQLLRQFLADAPFRKFSRRYPETHFSVKAAQSLLREFETGRFDIENEIEFMAVCKDLVRDKHIMSVITAKASIVPSYNLLADAYQLVKKSHADFDHSMVSLAKEENEYMQKLDELSNDSEFTESIKKSKTLATIYNSMVLIYNSIKKKQELTKTLR